MIDRLHVIQLKSQGERLAQITDTTATKRFRRNPNHVCMRKMHSDIFYTYRSLLKAAKNDGRFLNLYSKSSLKNFHILRTVKTPMGRRNQI
jgi:hypothetical protein